MPVCALLALSLSARNNAEASRGHRCRHTVQSSSQDSRANKCKSWYAIISNRQFSKLQLKQSTKNNNADDNHTLLIWTSSSPQLFLIDHEHDDYFVSKFDYPPPPPLEHNKHYYSSVGSCNGLFCLEFGRKIIIWNPSISQYKIVPDSYNSQLGFDVVYGFGFDSLSDDYKVVRLCYALGNIIVDIFNLKTNSWRSIDDPNYSFLPWRLNNLLDGSLHWLGMEKLDNECINMLVAFSLAEETFLEVPMPNVDDRNKFFCAMCVFEGCLCLSRLDRANSGVELWVMKEYMVRASWTKLCTVLWESIPKVLHTHVEFSPLFSSRDGDIFLGIHDIGVVKYNMQEKKCTSPVMKLERYGIIETHAHGESLVSPNL